MQTGQFGTFHDSIKCKKCGDTGYISERTEKGNCAKRCECAGRIEEERRRKKAGIEKAFESKTFENTEIWNKSIQECVEKSKRYADEFSNDSGSFLLMGQVGSGKTHVGVAIMNKLLSKGIQAMYVTYAQLMIDLKGNCLDQDNYRRAFDKYATVQVLMVDDMLKEHRSADLKYIYDIVNQRYITGKPIILTTEKTAFELVDIDEAVGTRLIQMAGSNLHIFPREQRYNYRMRALLEAQN